MNTLTSEHPPLTTQQARHAPLTTDADIEDRVLALIGTAGRRQLWFMLLDSDDRQIPIVMPIDDLPRFPDRTETDVLVGHLAGTLVQSGGLQMVLVWERPGRGKLTEPDAAWARALADNCARRGVRLRAQLLSHTRGVTLLAPADYATVRPAGRSATQTDVMRPGDVQCGVTQSRDVQSGVTPTAASSTAGTGC